MRTHFQGFALLILLVAAIWGAARLASPTLSDAFGEDGAVNAESEDRVNLVVDSEDSAPLTAAERERLQFQLLRGGFLENPADVDGIFGDKTRDAIQTAADAWGLESPSYRQVLDHADELFTGTLFAQ